MTRPHRGTPHPRFLLHRSDGLTDNHGRRITYLRLAITDRCNLRCRYCMPEDGVEFVPHEEILTFEEMERLVRLLSGLGLTKIRITGGEPFVRQGCLPFMERLRRLPNVHSLHVTTNGVATAPHLAQLAKMGIDGINLSLDTLDPLRFQEISRRNHLPQVLKTLKGCLDRKLPLKINAVVLDETTDAEIMALADLPRYASLSLRFIEKMPFSGGLTANQPQPVPLRNRLQAIFPGLVPVVPGAPSTARLHTLPGFVGTIGLIEGNSRRFCATCNKIRITPVGMLKTCLYDNGVLDLKEMLRGGALDHEIIESIRSAVQHRYGDGVETADNCARLSDPTMASIGG